MCISVKKAKNHHRFLCVFAHMCMCVCVCVYQGRLNSFKVVGAQLTNKTHFYCEKLNSYEHAHLQILWRQMLPLPPGSTDGCNCVLFVYMLKDINDCSPQALILSMSCCKALLSWTDVIV